MDQEKDKAHQEAQAVISRPEVTKNTAIVLDKNKTIIFSSSFS